MSINTINIQGTIVPPVRPLVFGFGNEADQFYPKIEVEEDREHLKNIKSFSYFKNEDYHELIYFIESEPYEVFIFGHSCGLLDKTLLQLIFENDNCHSIRQFYLHKKNGRRILMRGWRTLAANFLISR